MIFYNCIILPIESIVEFVFVLFYSKFSKLGVGGSIAAVSLVVNFLALPLYNMADALQLKERETQKKLKPGIDRIKKSFKGDEQYMILSTYYKQNKYHPLYSLRSSLSILIEIPFFIAAYHFLSHCSILNNAHFFLLQDLSKPDTLLRIGTIGIHVLPILMTLINIVSGAIYTKGAPLREKIQLYVMALLFLVLLYDSPSGLVFYWILNNIFSLLKNIVQKLPKPKLVVYFSLTSVLVLCCVYYAFMAPNAAFNKKLVLYLISALIIGFPPFFVFLKKKYGDKCSTLFDFNPTPLFLFSCLGIFLLNGFLLPSSIVATSPTEFAYVKNSITLEPLHYLFYSATVSFGLFVLWPVCIYKLFGKNIQKAFALLFSCGLFIALMNTFVFKFDYGTLDTFCNLQIQTSMIQFSRFFIIIPIIIAVVLIGILFSLLHFHKINYMVYLTIILCIATGSYGIKNCYTIKKVYSEYEISKQNNKTDDYTTELQPVYHFSKSGKNVIVLFLDRAVSSFLPYIMTQFPELNEQFSGFTYYPNCVSYGNHTLKGAPAMLGGYEYTPEKINEQSNRLLVDKHNEALLVMPKLFLDAGFDVTVTDPPFSNYHWKGDLTPYKKYPAIHVDELERRYSKRYLYEHKMAIQSDDATKQVERNISRFVLLETLYPPFRNTFYHGGDFFQIPIMDFSSIESFIGVYSELYYLPKLFDTSNSKDSYTFIDNETAHDFLFLKEPDYIPETVTQEEIDNAKCAYPYQSTKKEGDLQAYEVNAAAIRLVGTFLSALKENNVYDNSRIIIVADHGVGFTSVNAFKSFSRSSERAGYNPLLMVKDFNAKGKLVTDKTFMTNADTLFLAKAHLPIANVNPFTGKEFSSDEKKQGVNVYPSHDDFDGLLMINKTQLNLSKELGFYIHDNIFDENNWIPLLEKDKKE